MSSYKIFSTAVSYINVYLGLDERHQHVRQVLANFAVYLQIPEEPPFFKFHTSPSKGSRPLIHADRRTDRHVEAERCCSCERASLMCNDVRDQIDSTNYGLLIIHKLNMFRASSCPASGALDRMLPHMVFSTRCAAWSLGKPGSRPCALCKGLFE